MIIERKEVPVMLLQFKFSNYRSYAEEVVFDMLATPIKEHRESLIENNSVGILPVAAIYGANASGKSSFFMAMQRMLGIIIDKYIAQERKVESKPYAFNNPFMFDDDLASAPTSYEVTILINSYAYRYGFSCTKDTIINEYLYKRKFSKNPTLEKLIFNREGTDLTLGKINRQLQSEIEYCHSMATNKILLLTDIGLREKSEELHEIFVWFLVSDVYLNFCQEAITTSRICERFVGDMLESKKDTTFIKQYISFIQEIDPSICNITYTTEMDSDGNKIPIAKTVHKYNGKEIPVRLSVESDGTNKLLFISLILISVLNDGRTIFFDELDSKMHPLILRRIVQMFTNKETNPNGAQLIFSAHNIINLDASDLRRDEIWFVEKKNHKSTMCALANLDLPELNVRADLNYGKNYLNGRFGAVPFKDKK